MDEKKFNVVFSGKFKEGKSRNKIEEDLSKIFKLDIKSVKEAFRTGRRVIKNNVSHKTALKIADVLNTVGALCTVEEYVNQDLGKGSAVKGEEKNEKKIAKIKVVSLEFGGGDIALAPLTCTKITAAEGGININRAERQKISYGLIEFISIFHEEKCKILFFAKDSKRPFLADCDTIAFPEFPNVKGTSLLVSVRKFLIYILAKNSDIILDKGTYEFIRGDSPFVLKGDVVFLTTAMKKALSVLGLHSYPPGPGSPEIIRASTESFDGGRENEILEKCPKCGAERTAGQEACNSCGLVFVNWGRSQKPEEDKTVVLESPIEENDAALTEDYEDDFDVDVGLRQVDTWSENYTRLFSIMLILGILLPMTKYSESYNATVLVWPWQIAGLSISENIHAAMKGFSGRSNMALWSLIPIIGGVAGLLSIKLMSAIHRSILVSILGMVVFFLLVTAFVEEARILGVMFLPWSAVSGILYIIFLLSAGMIAMGNHLRKRFKLNKLLRIISGGGGIVLGLLTCLLFITSSGAWQALPMLILYVLIILYAVLGIYSAYKKVPDVALLSLTSKTSRATVLWAFLAALFTQSFYPDPTLAHVTAGAGLIHSLAAVTKCGLVYVGSAFMMVMGASALVEIALLKKAE